MSHAPCTLYAVVVPLSDVSVPVMVMFYCISAALRFCRRIVGLQDEFYNQYVERGDHFAPVVALFQRNSNRYNLINSAIVEMFNFIINVSILRLAR